MNKKHERGQSLVELAISLVILLYLLSGAVEFGIIFFQYVQLRDAAQEGALYASTHPYLDANVNGTFDSVNATTGEQTTANTAAIQARARQSSPTNSPINLQDPAVTVTVTSSDASNLFCEGLTAGGLSHGITVTVSYTHHIFMPFMPKLIGRSDIPLNATVTDTILTPMCP